MPEDKFGIHDLEHAQLDTGRRHRTGDPETVFAAGKSVVQLMEIMATLHTEHPDRPILATRVTPEQGTELGDAFPEASLGSGAGWRPEAGCFVLGGLPRPLGKVGVISAGTSDGAVAAEAEITIRCFGAEAVRINDVGVAGIHRVISQRERLDALDCLVVVAGMEGALPSVVGGLTGCPLVAVPTSVGYGASFNGLAALLGMLNSCAPGVVTVNIDNGYGAGVHAARVARAAASTG